MIVLALAFALSAPQEQPAQKVSISGTVADFVTDALLNKVRVLAEPVGRNGIANATTSDDKGNFTLVDLPPGAYRLRGIRNGYLSTRYGAKRADAAGTTLTLEAGAQFKDLQLKLIPFAVVAGTVLDPDGEGLAEARVALIAVRYRNGRRQAVATGQYATTDEAGRFRIPSVPPGSYYLHAGPPEQFGEWEDHSRKGSPEEILVPAFYPATTDIGSARKFDVNAGDRLEGADITLIRSKVYRVRVRLESPEGLRSGVGLDPRPNLSDGISPNLPSNCRNGVCEFRHVPAGSYTASAQISRPQMTITEMFSSHDRIEMPVDVTNGDVDDVHILITQPSEVTGHITIEESGEKPKLDFGVRFITPSGDDLSSRVGSDGSFGARLSRGLYEVEPYSPSGLIVKSMRSGDVDVLREGLNINKPEKVPLEIVLSRDGAVLDGVVRDKDDHAISAATVVLVPENALRARIGLYQVVSSDQLGHYHFAAVMPGSYKLFAWSYIEPDSWFDVDVLKDFESFGSPITLDAKAHANADLRVIVH
ncbi:MAG TPA: carboxypeptidase-like regulatory domain-containing protein [Bryobacteraceae bacterium]|nr:carboxypeptidase-like regulatory domain-containing protein [Bryobacteraceae bacterium]